jgi:ABC-2 type transport system permease protein
MLRGLWRLAWLETKIFLREPLGAFGTIGVPVLLFVGLGQALGGGLGPSSLSRTARCASISRCSFQS